MEDIFGGFGFALDSLVMDTNLVKLTKFIVCHRFNQSITNVQKTYKDIVLIVSFMTAHSNDELSVEQRSGG